MSDTDDKIITLIHSAEAADPFRKLAEDALAGGRLAATPLADGADHDDMVFSLRALEIEREVNQQQLRNSAVQAMRLQQRFDRIFGALPAVSMLIDAALSRIESINPMALSFFGPVAAVGRCFLNMGFTPETSALVRHALDETRQNGHAVVPAVGIVSYAGIPHQTRIQFDLIEPDIGGRAQILVQMADLAALPRDREGLMQSWLWLRLVTEGLEGVLPFLIEPGAPPRFRYVSPSFESLWGFPPAVLADDPSLWRAGIAEPDRPLWDILVTPGAGVSLAEFRLTQPDGALRPVQCRLYTTAQEGCLFGFVLDQQEHGVADLHGTPDTIAAFVRMLDFLTGPHADAGALFAGFCERFPACFSRHAKAAARIRQPGATHVSDSWREDATFGEIALRRDGHDLAHVAMQFTGSGLSANAVSWRSRCLAEVNADACTVMGRMLQQALDRL